MVERSGPVSSISSNPRRQIEETPGYRPETNGEKFGSALDNEAKFHGAKGLFVALLFDPQVHRYHKVGVFFGFDN